MKIIKIKKKSLFQKIIFAVAFIGIGFYIHMTLTPDFSAMMQPHQEPFVSVRALENKDVSIKKKFIAQVEAINQVDIVPQVAGYLQEVRFNDGAFVHEGDTLFIIEQKKFQATVDVAQANLEKAKSDLTQIQNDHTRQKQLYKDKYISKSSLDKEDNKLTQAKANIRQAEANLLLAQINLGYSEIKAPISGYIGKALISKGNYVSPAVQSLAKIVQTDPIRIGFSISDKDRLNFLQNIKDSNNIVRFEIVYPNGSTEQVSIDNIFSDNEIDPQTATIPVYIDYKNPNKLLIPGNYVDILVSVGLQSHALVVPMMALAQDINGTYAMIVNADNIVEQKYLTLGKVIDDGREVLSGLTASDKVIVQGLQKVQAGSKVNPIIVKE